MNALEKYAAKQLLKEKLAALGAVAKGIGFAKTLAQGAGRFGGSMAKGFQHGSKAVMRPKNTASVGYRAGLSIGGGALKTRKALHGAKAGFAGSAVRGLHDPAIKAGYRAGKYGRRLGKGYLRANKRLANPKVTVPFGLGMGINQLSQPGTQKYIKSIPNRLQRGLNAFNRRPSTGGMAGGRLPHLEQR